ncbi:MAG: hypothetical protein HY769_08590, partial [Candidatus Stahlbacteria bacterium]|nr:hypothetical protein [Candidatus Stahlbacteria bacterium]
MVKLKSIKLWEGLHSPEWKTKIDTELGNLPNGHSPWKKLSNNPKKADILSTYFSNLRQASGLGAELAKNYLAES